MRIFIIMKTRLNITIENTILMQVKAYAASNHMSISQIVEDHLKMIVKTSARNRSILDEVDQLESPQNTDSEKNLKNDFYEERAKKYGF